MKQFKVYQLPVEHKAKFMRLSFVRENNIMPKLEDYNLVGESHIYPKADTSVFTMLDDIFTTLNTCKCDWFSGHSLSVSDVVEIDGKYYYCDSYGWEEISFQPKNEPKKAYIVKAYSSCTYKAKFNTREEALAEANKLNDEYFEHKIWNVEEIEEE